MGRAPRKRFVGVWAVITTVMLAAAAACSNAGEGDRCEILNGSEDCQSGLVCTQVASQTSAVCCPPDRRTATALACTQNVTPITGDAAPPADTGPAEDASSTTDANEEADAAEEEDANVADTGSSDAGSSDAGDASTDDGATP